MRRCQLESVTSWTWILVIALSLYSVESTLYALLHPMTRRAAGPALSQGGVSGSALVFALPHLVTNTAAVPSLPWTSPYAQVTWCRSLGQLYASLRS